MIVILTLVILGWPAGMNPLLDEAMRVAGNINVPKMSKIINLFDFVQTLNLNKMVRMFFFSFYATYYDSFA